MTKIVELLTMAIIDIRTKKMRKLVQEMIDNAFAYMHAWNQGTEIQKKNAQKKFKGSVERMNDFLGPDAKIKKINQSNITTYVTHSKTGHVIKKPTL